MKRIWIVFYVLIVINGISYAGDDQSRAVNAIPITGLRIPQTPERPLIVLNPFHDTLSPIVISGCSTYVLPEGWIIQTYNWKGDECRIIYLGNACPGQQVKILDGQPIPNGWRSIRFYPHEGFRIIEYVGD